MVIVQWLPVIIILINGFIKEKLSYAFIIIIIEIIRKPYFNMQRKFRCSAKLINLPYYMLT